MLNLNDQKRSNQNMNTNLLMKYFSIKTKSYSPISIQYPKPSNGNSSSICVANSGGAWLVI